MRFVNINDNFEIAKTIVMNAMIRILINFMQRISKFYTFVFNNKCFFVDANKKRNINQNINI